MSMKWIISLMCLAMASSALAGTHDKDWQIASQARQITKLQVKVDTLVHENAQLKAENKNNNEDMKFFYSNGEGVGGNSSRVL